MNTEMPAIFIAVPNFRKLSDFETRIQSAQRSLSGIPQTVSKLMNADEISAAQSGEMLERAYGKPLGKIVEGAYFGNDTCENLIPSVPETLNAVNFCADKGWKFVFVTPYAGPDAMEKLREVFRELEAAAPGTEVVVNEFGVLRTLISEFPGLVPTLGRLFVRMKRDPRYSRTGFPISGIGIEDLGTVQKNQSETVQSCSLEVPAYSQFLKKKGVARVAADFVPSGIDHSGWDFPVDAYWPWSYVMSGRACMIAAQTQPDKAKHPTDAPCHHQCQEYELQMDAELFGTYDTVQRGNAVWMNGTGLFDHVLAGGFERLVYEPFIPV